MSEELLTEVPAHLEEVLSTLKELQRRLDGEMNSGLAGSKGAGVNQNHVKMAVSLASASSQLGRECRAWLKRVGELAKTASLEERMRAVILFVNDLPEGLRAKLLADIHE